LGSLCGARRVMEAHLHDGSGSASSFADTCEIVPQALAALPRCSAYWVNHPGKKWLTWLLSVVFCLMMAMSMMALAIFREIARCSVS